MSNFLKMTAGQHCPPEWAPQSGVILSWPNPDSDWAPWLARVETVYVELARQISEREKLLIVCRNAAHRQQVLDTLRGAAVDTARIRVWCIAYNDTWVRDYGPITVYRDNRPCLLDFTFNGWGGKYPAHLDNQASANLHAAGAFGSSPLQSVDLVLEGGSIELDGAGTLLTTAQCLLTPTRNPHLNRAQIERRLGELLGIQRVLWLEHGALAGDDTDSHVDTLARFCNPTTIAYVSCDDPTDEHYAELAAMAEELRALRTLKGEPYTLVPLPLPGAKRDAQGQRLPATYANFLIINGAVLVPTYDDPADAIALERLRPCFPGRQIVPVPSLPLIHQFGSIHCVTMQLPAGVL